MDNSFALNRISMQKLQMAEELRSCNELTVHYGLSLSEAQIQTLTERRFEALRSTGRVEFGQGVLKKLIIAFCDSPYLTRENYEDTLLELQESFYYFKNESMDRLSDEELISFMKRHFDGYCQGSMEYLTGTTLEELCRYARYGYRSEDTDPYDRC